MTLHGECDKCGEIYYSRHHENEHVCMPMSSVKPIERDKPEVSCENCLYWDLSGFKKQVEEANPLTVLDDNTGVCHRYPQYEIRVKEYWCGEFKLKDDKPFIRR